MRIRTQSAMQSAATVGLLCLLGCDVDPNDPNDPNAPSDPPNGDLWGAEKLRNGTVTSDRMEVGRISGCTATLVAQDVVITASHCVGYNTRTNIGNYNTFTLDNGQRYTVNRYRSFSRELGEDDIALLGLSEMVPLEVATPAPMARETPEQGTSLTVFGYGCTQIGGRGDGQKRKATYAQGDVAAHLCPGDSGGPVFNDETGAVARINSGYWFDRGNTDIYGLTPGLYDDLVAQVEEWTQGEVPSEGEPLDPSVEVCGRNTDVFDHWTCSPSRTHRHRCLPGGSPIWEACDNGCVSGTKGEADTCRLAGAPDSCGEAYRPFGDWVCATDDLTLVRCAGGALQTEACRAGCDAIEGADACL